MAWFPPDINIGVLSSVTLMRKRLKENPKAFEDPDCKYSLEVREWFLKEIGASSVEAIALAVSEVQDLETEARDLFSMLKSMKPVNNTDQKETIAYVKVGTQLLEKLLDCQERAAGIAEIEQFKRVVIETMDDLMPPEMRTQFMDRLKAIE